MTGDTEKGQVDQGGEERLALELELGDRPCGGNAEDQIERHGDDGNEQRQLDRGKGFGV